MSPDSHILRREAIQIAREFMRAQSALPNPPLLNDLARQYGFAVAVTGIEILSAVTSRAPIANVSELIYRYAYPVQREAA